MHGTTRILSVTAGLIVGGAIFGAVSAVLSLVIGSALTGTLPQVLSHGRGLLGFVSALGAVFGVALFPAAAWLLMRRVPVGQALLGTGAATIAGGVIGWLVPARDAFLISLDARTGPDQVLDAVAGAVIGFLAATVILRLAAGRAEARREAARVSVA
jgi:hypothetical protein